MTSTLKTPLNKDFTLCQQLWLDVFIKDGYDVNFWIERNSDRKHFELSNIFDKERNEIEQRLEVRFAPKFLAGVEKLKKINNLSDNDNF